MGETLFYLAVAFVVIVLGAALTIWSRRNL